MTIDSLLEFVSLAETKSFWETAEQLHLGQPTLSKHIRAMEEELSVPLFVRTSRSVALSDYGERFLPYATDIVRRYFDGTRLLRETKEIKNGKVVFGAIPILPQYGITRIIAAFSARYPEDSLRVYDAGSLQLKEDLRAGRCEIAFSPGDRKSRGDPSCRTGSGEAPLYQRQAGGPPPKRPSPCGQDSALPPGPSEGELSDASGGAGDEPAHH